MMSLLGSFSYWVQNLAFFTALRQSELVYPVVLSLHLSCIALFGGLILITDLRLLGLALKSRSISDVVRGTRPWKYVGLIAMLTLGALLAGSKLNTYYDNPYFQTKILLLLMVGVHALIFRRSVYCNTQALDRAPRMPAIAKIAALSSIAIWITIITMGRWIAYYDRPGQIGRLEHLRSDRVYAFELASAHINQTSSDLNSQNHAYRQRKSPVTDMTRAVD